LGHLQPKPVVPASAGLCWYAPFDFHLRIWNYAEPAWREYKSAKAYRDLLRTEGFAVEEGSGEMRTAFAARWGKSGPVLAPMPNTTQCRATRSKSFPITRRETGFILGRPDTPTRTQRSAPHRSPVCWRRRQRWKGLASPVRSCSSASRLKRHALEAGARREGLFRSDRVERLGPPVHTSCTTVSPLSRLSGESLLTFAGGVFTAPSSWPKASLVGTGLVG
jgi:hypothetical protein